MKFIDDLIELANEIQDLSVIKSPAPAIIYQNQKVTEIARCARTQEEGIIAEDIALEDLAKQPVSSARINDVFAYLITLENGQKIILDKIRGIAEPYSEKDHNYPIC